MSLQMGRVTTQALGHSGRSTSTIATWVLVLMVPVLGYVAALYGWYAVLVGVVIMGLGVLSLDARILPLLAVPCTLLIMRVESGSTNLSLSDLVLFLATLWALLVFRLREAPEVRPLLTLVAVYQATTLFAVILNPYRSNAVEWFHEAFLVAGGLMVGWVVGRQGSARAALSIYVGGATLLAVSATGWAALHHLQPAYPFGIQKNYVGDMLAFAVLLIYARPDWLGWQGRTWRPVVLTICLLGILASQSKQAMVSLAVGVAVLLVRDRSVSRRSKAILTAIVPLGILAYVGVSHELVSTNQFNGVHQRLTWLHQSLQLWHLAPWFGVGLRWWYTGRFAFAFQPPNAELEVLTSAGIVGLVGFIVLILGSFQVLRRLPNRFGTLALAIVVMRVVQGQLDIFWVGAMGSLPWMVVGVALGVLAMERCSVDRSLSRPDLSPWPSAGSA